MKRKNLLPGYCPCVFISILLALCFVIPSGHTVLAENQEGESQETEVIYIDETGKESSCSDYQVVTESTLEMQSGWYVANADTTVSGGRIAVAGDVRLILLNGITLNAETCFSAIREARRFRIYAIPDG